MRKIAAFISSGMTYLFVVGTTYAQDVINIGKPKLKDAAGNVKNVGYSDISLFINNIIVLIFIIALIIVLFMLVWGAVEWILSGGDKDKVGNAQKRITHALIGFAVLAVAFAIARLAGQFLGFDIFGQLTIPSPNDTPAPTT